MVLYFAYGSNLDDQQMKSRCSDARPLAVGRLPGYCLDFTRYSSGWSGGVADVVGCDGSDVWGLVYEISIADLERLDQFEGFPDAYIRFQAGVEAQSGLFEDVWVYTVRDKCPFVAPSPAYLNVITLACRKYGFPDSYRKRLEQIKARS